MLSYDRVRVSLRGILKLPVVLTEIKKVEDASDNFPPLIERDPKDVKRGVIKPVPWEQYKDVPIMLWYPPFPLDPYTKKHSEGEKNKIIQDLNPEESNRPRVVSKGMMKDFNNLRRIQHENNVIVMEKNVLYSGECDWPFKIKICAVENIIKMFELAEERSEETDPTKNAIWNGFYTPKYVTKVVVTKEKGEHAPKKAVKSEDEKSKASVTPKLIKFKERESTHQAKMKSPNEFKNMHTHHGLQGSSRFSVLAKKYGLNFTPYMIEVEVSLYYGGNLVRDQEGRACSR